MFIIYLISTYKPHTKIHHIVKFNTFNFRVWGISPNCISPGCVSPIFLKACGVLKKCGISPN